MKNFKLNILLISLLSIMICESGNVFGQSDSTSSVIINNFQVSEIINNLETMEVEGYFLEFNISNSDMLSNLTFEVETPIDTGEVNLTQYQLEIIEKENGIYLAIQNNHFHIKNGTVQMHIAIDPILLNEEIVYKLTGVDKQGINTNQAEFSQIQ